jgi:predicted nucleic acid-binding Zn ribbon protein
MFHAERIPTTANERTETEEGPHFHCVVDTTIDPERVLCCSAQIETVIKGMGRARNLTAHIEYILSHLGIPNEAVAPGQTNLKGQSINPAIVGIVETKLHTIRWFGTWCRLKTTEKGTRFCKICNQEVPEEHWARVRWIPFDRPPPEEEWIDGTDEEWHQVTPYGWGE